MVEPQTRRQAILVVTIGLCALMDSFIFGHGVSMVAALYMEKDELDLTDDIISWIMATVFSPMVFGGMMATVLNERFGRRITLTMFNFPIIFHWVILHFARSGVVLILCRLLAGFCFGGTLPTIYIAISEYSPPNKRGSNFALASSLAPVGIFVGQFLGLVFHWRTAALIAIVPAVFAAVLPLLTIESPQWLASRGKFKECEEAFRKLHGYKLDKELQLLLEVEKCKLERNETRTKVILALMKNLKLATTKRYFWNVMFLGYVIQLYKIVCGFILKGNLGVTILQHITGDSEVLRFTLLGDGLMFFGCAVAPFILRKLKTKVLIIYGGLLNNAVLIVFCIILYLNLNNDATVQWVKTFLLGLHYFVLSATIYPLLEMVPQEMYPLEIKTGCTTIITFFSTMTLFVYTKTIPGLCVSLNYYGVYMISVLIMFLCLLIFWIKLPETKGRTLQEVELYFKNGKFVDIDDLIKGDEIKDLV